MDPVEAAQKLTAVGRYREALDALPSSSGPSDRVPFQMLKAELFVTVGEPGHAHVMVETLEKSRSLTESDRSRCELVLSKVEEERGNFDSELRHLQKSFAHAERAHDLDSVLGSIQAAGPLDRPLGPGVGGWADGDVSSERHQAGRTDRHGCAASSRSQVQRNPRPGGERAASHAATPKDKSIPGFCGLGLPPI